MASNWAKQHARKITAKARSTQGYGSDWMKRYEKAVKERDRANKAAAQHERRTKKLGKPKKIGKPKTVTWWAPKDAEDKSRRTWKDKQNALQASRQGTIGSKDYGKQERQWKKITPGKPWVTKGRTLKKKAGKSARKVQRVLRKKTYSSRTRGRY